MSECKQWTLARIWVNMSSHPSVLLLIPENLLLRTLHTTYICSSLSLFSFEKKTIQWFSKVNIWWSIKKWSQALLANAETPIHFIRILCESYLCQICHFDFYSVSIWATSPTVLVLLNWNHAHYSMAWYFWFYLHFSWRDRLSVIELQLFLLNIILFAL